MTVFNLTGRLERDRGEMRLKPRMTYIVQQPDANTNPTSSYRVVLQTDVAEAIAKDSVVFEDYGRYATREKAQADADKWNGENKS